jgi:hypothetical protein
VWTAHNRGLEVADKSAARQAYVEKYVAFASYFAWRRYLQPLWDEVSGAKKARTEVESL